MFEAGALPEAASLFTSSEDETTESGVGQDTPAED
jgi:hypothetical protein